MKLVIDANIAFSLLKKDSFTRELAKNNSLNLYSHYFILEELSEHSEELLKKLNLPLDKLERIKEILSRLVNLKEKFSPQQLNMAKRLISDSDDAPYLALAIKLNIPIWSNDPHLKEQSVIKVFKTEELKEFLDSVIE